MQGHTSIDREEDLAKLRSSFQGHLTTSVAERLEIPYKSTEGSDFVFRLSMRAKRHHARTYLLDVVNLTPFLLGGLLVPEWGSATVTGALEVFNADGKSIGYYQATSTHPFSMIFYSWYRAGPIEDAFRDSYTSVFRSLVSSLLGDSAALAQALASTQDLAVIEVDNLLRDPESPPSSAQASSAMPKIDLDLVLGNSTGRAADEATEPPTQPLFSFIVDAKPPPQDNMLYRSLHALGGFEGAGFMGEATVTSSITREDGEEIEIANGRARHSGYRFTLYDAPETTGFYWYPVVGFLDQRIDITDFYEDVPQLVATAGTDIDADCTLIEYGEVIPCGTPNTYSLRMQSVVAGLRVGASVVVGNPWFQVIASATAGANLMEWRTIDASLGGMDQGRREGVDFMQSAAVGSTFGFVFPKLHLALRAMFNYEVYQAFEFDHAIEFMGPTVCDFEIGRCERERAFVDSTSLTSWTMQFAAGVVF